jgi:hypothetical protein
MVQLSYEYKVEEIIEVLHAKKPRYSRFIGILGGIVVLVLIAGAIYAATDKRYGDASALVVLSLLLFVSYPARALGLIKSKPPGFPSEIAGTYQAGIAEDALHFDSPTARRSHSWSDFIGQTETEHLVVLCQRENEVRAIPKRAMTANQLQDLRTLLGQKLPKCKIPDKPTVLF